MTALPQSIDLAEFLRWEAEQPDRHEFSEGTILSLPGGTKRHSAIAIFLASTIHACLRETSRRVFGSDMMVVTGSSGRYPDVTVTCEERDLQDLAGSTIRHPRLIVEVLSESTVATDRGAKLDEYRTLESLEEYVLVDSRRRWVATFRRVGDDWIASLPATTGDVRLASIGLTISLDELYAEARL